MRSVSVGMLPPVFAPLHFAHFIISAAICHQKTENLEKILRRKSLVYHQGTGKYTLKRDMIQERKAPLMIYAALRASMIYQACGLDKKITTQMSRYFLSMGYKVDILRKRLRDLNFLIL